METCSLEESLSSRGSMRSTSENMTRRGELLMAWESHFKSPAWQDILEKFSGPMNIADTRRVCLPHSLERFSKDFKSPEWEDFWEKFSVPKKVADTRREVQEIFRASEEFRRKETPQESWAAYSESVVQRSRGVLYGDLYDEGPPSEEASRNPSRVGERVEFFASLGSVEELKDFIFNMKLVLDSILSRSTSAGFLNLSVSEEFRSSLLGAVESRNWEEVERMVMPIAAALPRRAALYDAFIFLLSLLLSAMFLYLMALVDKGGTNIHSSGSLEFRSRYISIVLFQGAYVWIKFREVAPPSQQKPSRGLRRKCYVMDSGVKWYYGNFEPRFKPPGSDNSIYVGLYEEEDDARIIYQILAFYYGREVPGELPLLDGSTYRIPCMTEEEQWLDPESKKEWAKDKAKDVFEEFKRALKDSIDAWLSDLQEVEATGGVSNTLPPDAGAGCDGQPIQLGNESDGLNVPVSPSNSSPNVGPEMQVNVGDDSCNDHTAAAGAGFSYGPPLEPHFQHHALEENQANNVNPDDLSVLRLVKELQRQQQLQQFQLQQLAFQNQQLEFQNSVLQRNQQLLEFINQQQASRISELEDKVEPARKRLCVGVTLTHNPQN